MAGIFLIHDGTLTELTDAPFGSEDEFQHLLAGHPKLLAGDRTDEVVSRWLLVRREMEIPGEECGHGRWSVDHLFLDQEGRPTLVEVKRAGDTRIRRELVGQMLDYAANAVAYWPAASIRAEFEARCAAEGKKPDEELAEVLSPGEDADAFWAQVDTNLTTGNIRMLFVADHIPAELRRIIEFLNGQMKPAEVLALELKQYANGSTRTLVPRTIGRTTEAERKKASPPRITANWDEDSFFGRVDEDCAPPVAAAVRRIYEWAHKTHAMDWATKTKYPYAYITHQKSDSYICSLNVGSVSVLFSWIREIPPFDKDSSQQDLLDRLNAIPGVAINRDSFGRTYRDIKLDKLSLPGGAEQLIAVLSWISEQIDAHTEQAIA